jgi:hypothetical protein
MSSSDVTVRVEPLSPPAVINPGPDAQPSLNLADDANRRKQKTPTPTERAEARADRHIEELRDDKKKLGEEIERLRNEEIPRLHSRIQEAEAKLTQQYALMARLETSYEWAIHFTWFSSVLVGLGGAIISYASFVKPEGAIGEKLVADFGLASLIIGIALQAMVSLRGGKTMLRKPHAPPGQVSDAVHGSTPTKA